MNRDNAVRVADVRQQLDRVLESPIFRRSDQLCDFLRYIVDETLQNRGRALKQYTIAVRALGRLPDFNPKANPIVRIEAGRLRRRLEQYYATYGEHDPVVIVVPSGSYQPQFHYQEATSHTLQQNSNHSSSETIVRILVTVFRVPGNQQDLTYIANGLAELISARLTQFDSFPITCSYIGRTFDSDDALEQARNRGVMFLVGGRLRRTGEKLQLSVTLLDTKTEEIIYLQTFETDSLDDIVSFEDAVCQQITVILASGYGVVTRHLVKTTTRQHVRYGDSLEAILRTYHYFQVFTPDAHSNALSALEHAVANDPHNALTHAMMADLFMADYHLNGASEELLNQAGALVNRALMLDPKNQYTNMIRADYAFLTKKPELVMQAVKHAITLNPYRADIFAGCGLFVCFIGEWSHGLDMFQHAMNLNPYYPTWYHLPFSVHAYLEGDYETALYEARNINTPQLVFDPIMRAASLAQLGQLSEARSVIDNLLSDFGWFIASGRNVMHRTLYHEETVEKLLEGLSKAGYQPNLT